MVTTKPTPTPTPTPPPPLDEAVERANRVRAMLARWSVEVVSDEPEWNVEDVAPIALEPEGGDRNPTQ